MPRLGTAGSRTQSWVKETIGSLLGSSMAAGMRRDFLAAAGTRPQLLSEAPFKDEILREGHTAFPFLLGIG